MRDDTTPDRDPAPRGGARSWPLLLTSALMIVALFCLANPAFGVASESWPWEAFVGPHVTPRVTGVTGLWLLTAAWTLLFSIAGPRRLRAVGAVALGALLLLECTLGGSPLAVTEMPLGTMVALVALGAGLWLARGPRQAGVRALAGIGGFLVIWIPAATFEGGGGQSDLAAYIGQLETLFRDLSGTSALPEYLWDALLPQTLILFAAAFGLLVSFGTRMPRTSRIVFFLVLAALLVPGVVAAFAERRSAADAPEQASVSTGVFATLLTQLFERGVLLWALVALAIADLTRARRRDDDFGEVDA